VKHKQLAFILAASAILLTSESANSQWQWMPDVCGGYSDSWSASCRHDSNGNNIDGNTGKVYDPSGNPIQLNGESIDSLYQQASDENRRENYIAASQIYMRIISLNPQEAQAYFNLGSIQQLNLNDRNAAIANFQTALQLFQQQGDGYMTRASIDRINTLTGRY
jgi:tetratricopeptide (TPR) repeat protein